MSPEFTRPRLLLTDIDSYQLATLIANMIEDHLRATSSTTQPLSFEQEMRHDRQDLSSTFAEDSICVHSSVGQRVPFSSLHFVFPKCRQHAF